MLEGINIKFSVVVLPGIWPFPDLSGAFYFDESTFATTGCFSNLIDAEDNKIWKEWLGTLFWEKIFEEESLILVTISNSKTPPFIDTDNQLLSEKINRLYEGFVLTDIWRHSGKEAYYFSGNGNKDEKGIHFKVIKEAGPVNIWHHSLFYESDLVWKWQEKMLTSHTRIGAWKSNFLMLDLLAINKTESMVNLGMMAFRSGWESDLLDFRVPDFVRAIETVLALPKRTGKTEFAKRAKQLLPSNLSLPFDINISSITPILEDVYQIRSDCVHGKPFADTLRSAIGSNFEVEIMKYEIGIEMAARIILQNALANQSILSNSKTRADLEKAWDLGKITAT